MNPVTDNPGMNGNLITLKHAKKLYNSHKCKKI